MGLEPGGASWRPSISSANQVNKMDNNGRSAGGGTSYFAQGEGESEESLKPSYDEFTPSSNKEDDFSLDVSLLEIIKEFFNSIIKKIKNLFK